MIFKKFLRISIKSYSRSLQHICIILIIYIYNRQNELCSTLKPFAVLPFTADAKTKCAEKFSRTHIINAIQLGFKHLLNGVLLYTLRSNLMPSLPFSNAFVRSRLFSYIWTLPKLSVIDLRGKSICLAIRYR